MLFLKSNFGRACLGLVASTTIAVSAASASSVYTLQFYNIDDTMTGYISNSAFSGQEVLQASFLQDTGPVDISSFVRPGSNDILVTDYNGPAGWTYGFDFKIDGVTYDSGVCGSANTIGCNNSDVTHTIRLFFLMTLYSARRAYPRCQSLPRGSCCYRDLRVSVLRHIDVNPEPRS